MTKVISSFNYLSQLLIVGLSPCFRHQAQTLSSRPRNLALRTTISQQHVCPRSSPDKWGPRLGRTASWKTAQGRLQPKHMWHSCMFPHCVAATSFSTSTSLGTSPVPLTWMGVIPTPSLRGGMWCKCKHQYIHQATFFLDKAWDFPGGSDGNESTCNAGDLASIPGSGRSPEDGNGNPLQYSCLENSMDRGAWWATIQESQRIWHDWATNIFTFTLGAI